MPQAAGLASLSAGAAEDFADPLLLFLKSVAYHPLPFNWKLGADNCFEKVSAWHCGQASTLAALTLRITSCLKPQLVH